MKPIDITGKRFGHLVVSKLIEARNKSREALWECRCDCGNVIYKPRSYLLRHPNPSCGCFERISSKNGYKSWATMLQRCYNKNTREYKYYGGRGIKVCDRWREGFRYFLEDMGERPKGFTLDRIDVNGDYCPGNCRWATIREQSFNKRNTIRVEYNGLQLTLEELSQKIGIKRKTLYARLYIYGWDFKRAVNEKLNKR